MTANPQDNNPANWNGILPGTGWPANLPETEDDEGFFTDHIKPFVEQGGTKWVLEQAHAQWRELFPGSTAKDRIMFMAGVITMMTWIVRRNIITRNANPPPGPEGVLWIRLDELDQTIAYEVRRLCSIVFAIDEGTDMSELEALLKETPDV